MPSRNLERISQALKAHAPHLKVPALRKIAVFMLHQIRAMMALTFDPEPLNSPGAAEELRISVRACLTTRLKRRPGL